MTRGPQGRGIFGPGEHRICAVAAAPTAKEMARQIRGALRETRSIELRLDWLRNSAEIARFLAWLRRQRIQANFLATCRRAPHGGRFRGGLHEQIEVLRAAVEAGCRCCDIEIESLRGIRPETARKMLPGAKLLASNHDFQRTPKNLKAILAETLLYGTAGAKIATQANSIADSVRILRAAKNRKNVVAVPMGEIALPARILALRQGSALAYAPVATATAPGQVSLPDLKNLYRAHRLSRQTRVYGVIGDPVGHSLSPYLHNAGFVGRRIDAVYLPFLVKELPDFLKAVPEFGVRGFSVTLPHKQAILRYLGECEPLAAEIGAVNTVVVRGDGSLYGSNTDYVGVLRSLQKHLSLRGSRILIFGAGGAARAAAFALSRAGARVAVCSRRDSQARSLARAVGGEALPRRALRTETFDALLNATPVGMYPRFGISPLSPGEIHCRIVMDLVYRPERTKLLRLAARRGCRVVPGLEMFLAQGIAQWEIWTGRHAPEAAMRRAVISQLRTGEDSGGVRGPR